MTDPDTKIDLIASDIRGLLDISSRVDERLKSIQEEMARHDRRITLLYEQMQQMNSRIVKIEATRDIALRADIDSAKDKVRALEYRMQTVESSQSVVEAKWKSILTFAVQILTACTSAYLLWRLGLSSGSP